MVYISMMRANPCDQYPDSLPHNVPRQRRDPHRDIPDLYYLLAPWNKFHTFLYTDDADAAFKFFKEIVTVPHQAHQ
jgi:hypothetical protein